MFFTMTLLHTAWFFGSLERVELSVAVKSKHTQSNFDKTHWPTIGTKIVETPSSSSLAQACLGEGGCGEEKASFSPFEVGKSHKVPYRAVPQLILLPIVVTFRK